MSKLTDSQSDSLDRLVRLCVANHTPEELALGWLRYEALRRVSPRIFAAITRRNLGGECFDDIVTEALMTWKHSRPGITFAPGSSESVVVPCNQAAGRSTIDPVGEQSTGVPVGESQTPTL